MARETNSRPGRVRIIAGRWRGRRIAFPDLEGLRPTPDRVRETVFNWLAPVITGARVLDLFAGSGILGLEALSRGASSVTAVDNSALVGRRLRDAARELQTADLQVVTGDARAFMQTYAGPPFDIVFLDPPHAGAGYEDLCGRLDSSAAMGPGTLVYVELPATRAPAFTAPGSWERHRASAAGGLAYQLWRRVRVD